MKQYKKIIAAVAAAAILALPLSGCSFNDVMLYLYGGDSFKRKARTTRPMTAKTASV